MSGKLKPFITYADGLSIDPLPILAGFCGLSIYLLLASFYHYRSVVHEPFAVNSLSWSVDFDDTTKIAPPIESDPDKIKNAVIPTSRAQFQLEEFSARAMWLCSDFLMIAVGLLLVIKSMLILNRELEHAGKYFIALAVIPGGVLWILQVMASIAGPGLGILDSIETRAATIATSSADNTQVVGEIPTSSLAPIRILDSTENLLVLTACFLFAFAIGCLSRKCDIQTVDIAKIVHRYRDSSILLNICSVFLVLGVFHLWTQWNWPTSFLRLPRDRAFVHHFSNALALSIGALFTVLLGMIYFTANARIQSTAYQVAARDLEDRSLPVNESAVARELEERGYTWTTFDLSTILKVLSPLIAAGPVAQILSMVYDK